MPITIDEEQMLDLLEEALEAVRNQAQDVYRMFAAPGTDWLRLAGRIEAVLIAGGRTLPREDDDQ